MELFRKMIIGYFRRHSDITQWVIYDAKETITISINRKENRQHEYRNKIHLSLQNQYDR